MRNIDSGEFSLVFLTCFWIMFYSCFLLICFYFRFSQNYVEVILSIVTIILVSLIFFIYSGREWELSPNLFRTMINKFPPNKYIFKALKRSKRGKFISADTIKIGLHKAISNTMHLDVGRWLKYRICRLPNPVHLPIYRWIICLNFWKKGIFKARSLGIVKLFCVFEAFSLCLRTPFDFLIKWFV